MVVNIMTGVSLQVFCYQVRGSVGVNIMTDVSLPDEGLSGCEYTHLFVSIRGAERV